MQFVKEFPCLDSDISDNIKKYVQNFTGTFKPSMIYESDIDVKHVIPEKRLSEFRIIINPHFFDLFDKLIQIINQKDSFIEYKLVRNDITHIKYNTGGYFKAHEDYLSLTSNVIQEYTMIMCIEGNCQGGETILHLNEFFKHSSKATITPNNILIFRKDICHEGAEIISGHKEILTANLWGFSKNYNDTIIAVTCSDKTVFTFFLNDIQKYGQSLLNSFSDYEINQHKNNNKILCYNETIYDGLQFKIIKNIYQGNKITLTEYNEYKEIIDYYGFNIEKLLTEIINNEIHSKNDKIPIENNDFVICDSHSKYIYILDHFVKNNELPWIQIMFGEGTVSWGGDSEGYAENIEINPLYASFSEAQNIMFFNQLLVRNFEHIKPIYSTSSFVEFNYPIDKNPYYQKFNNLKDGNAIDFVEEELADELYDDDDIDSEDRIIFIRKPCSKDNHSYYDESTYFGLNFYFKMSEKDIVEKLIDEDKYTIHSAYFCGENKNYKKELPYYLINNDNELVLAPNKLNAIRTRINDVQLYNNIIKQLNNVDFVLPQVNKKFSKSFCNESVYGNFKFIMVYGFLKME